ncbi:hypothetical protein DIPPA_34009 [Diplonema papillatum]|nr:hypothetical protein DIPPA_34009 [Diplonema papillatum]
MAATLHRVAADPDPRLERIESKLDAVLSLVQLLVGNAAAEGNGPPAPRRHTPRTHPMLAALLQTDPHRSDPDPPTGLDLRATARAGLSSAGPEDGDRAKKLQFARKARGGPSSPASPRDSPTCRVASLLQSKPAGNSRSRPALASALQLSPPGGAAQRADEFSSAAVASPTSPRDSPTRRVASLFQSKPAGNRPALVSASQLSPPGGGASQRAEESSPVAVASPTILLPPAAGQGLHSTTHTSSTDGDTDDGQRRFFLSLRRDTGDSLVDVARAASDQDRASFTVAQASPLSPAALTGRRSPVAETKPKPTWNLLDHVRTGGPVAWKPGGPTQPGDQRGKQRGDQRGDQNEDQRDQKGDQRGDRRGDQWGEQNKDQRVQWRDVRGEWRDQRGDNRGNQPGDPVSPRGDQRGDKRGDQWGDQNKYQRVQWRDKRGDVRSDQWGDQRGDNREDQPGDPVSPRGDQRGKDPASPHSERVPGSPVPTSRKTKGTAVPNAVPAQAPAAAPAGAADGGALPGEGAAAGAQRRRRYEYHAHFLETSSRLSSRRT